MSNIEQLFFLLKTHNFKTDGLENYLSDSPLETKTDGTTKDDSHWEYAFEVIVENQRGIKFLGIPLFSGKSLLPLVDPPMYQRLDGVKISLAHESMSNYPLPAIDWSWSWPSWYVLMLHDVDEAGWVYSPFWKPSTFWHGKYCLGDFVRRRIWVRKRERERQSES